MARTPKRLAAVELTSSSVVMYEVPDRLVTQVAACTATNKTATNRTVTVEIVPVDEDALNLVYEVTVPKNTQVALFAVVGHVLGAGDAINAFASANNAIDFVMSGFETY